MRSTIAVNGSSIQEHGHTLELIQEHKQEAKRGIQQLPMIHLILMIVWGLMSKLLWMLLLGAVVLSAVLFCMIGKIFDWNLKRELKNCEKRGEV